MLVADMFVCGGTRVGTTLHTSTMCLVAWFVALDALTSLCFLFLYSHTYVTHAVVCEIFGWLWVCCV